MASWLVHSTADREGDIAPAVFLGKTLVTLTVPLSTYRMCKCAPALLILGD